MKHLKIEGIYKSIMIIVPHQDDEILMSAGIIYESVKAGIDIKVVIVTNGDYECRDFSKGRARLMESVEGTKVLGLSEEQLIFLGYADTGMPEDESFLMKLYKEPDAKRVYSSACGNETYALEEKPEFHMEKYGAHASYTRENIEQDLKTVLKDYRPDCIFTTCEFDLHGDHSGLFLFVRDLLEELGVEERYHPSLYCGLIHSCAGDEVWPDRESSYFDYPQGFDVNGILRWEERYSLSMPEELSMAKGEGNLKYQALARYEVALEPNAVDFLMSFMKDEEIFWRILSCKGE